MKTACMPKSAGKSANRVRIIGGKWRGTRLSFPSLQGLRPSADRNRETLFNWLQNDIVGARCLDLFAGSGALGFEALSRGAGYALLLDRQAPVVKQLQQHRDRLQAEHCDIQQADTLAWLRQCGVQNASRPAFDIIFLDPPYSLKLIEPCLQLIEQNACLREGGLLYLEYAHNDKPPQLTPRWQEIRLKSSGQVNYALLRFGGLA